MKKLLLLIGLMLTLASCKPDNTVEITQEEYNQLKGDTVRPKYPKPFKLYDEVLHKSSESNGILLGSDQHEYLVIEYWGNRRTIEHYIDCELCQKRREEPNIKIKYTDNER